MTAQTSRYPLLCELIFNFTSSTINVVMSMKQADATGVSN